MNEIMLCMYYKYICSSRGQIPRTLPKRTPKVIKIDRCRYRNGKRY